MPMTREPKLTGTGGFGRAVDAVRRPAMKTTLRWIMGRSELRRAFMFVLKVLMFYVSRIEKLWELRIMLRR
jgi:hypothetical protein